ncbi:hypothetical protein PsorP6_008986 [Peronosclerospora sorghi]|uniref:Uncharacterized protein n=1 Tax=Peronosclerospora sorghi TaxID=230839 RepID=A0ACC0W0F6_9STRA|nr:hypothetical protein PsorP6_008986 [Peronosclerospora sorghi]
MATRRKCNIVNIFYSRRVLGSIKIIHLQPSWLFCQGFARRSSQYHQHEHYYRGGGTLNLLSSTFLALMGCYRCQVIFLLSLVSCSAQIITWVPTTDVHSSTFDPLLINSFGLERVNSVGIHLHAELKGEAAYRFSENGFAERIETNIRNILHQILPSIKILPNTSHGSLAKSFCNYRSWKTMNPLDDIFHERVATSTLCYSASFPFTLTSKISTLFDKSTLATAVDSLFLVEQAMLETKESFNTNQFKHRLTSMELTRDAASSAMVHADIWRVGVYQSLDTNVPWETLVPVHETIHDFQIITSITGALDFYKLEHAWICQDGKPVLPDFRPSVANVHLPKATVAASAQVALIGEGFHRRYIMDVELVQNEVCEKQSRNKLILLRMPIAETAYVDLDEIRWNVHVQRMERFGDLKLLSFTKHIEIERPSPVSSQHMIGLEFTMPSTNQVSLEFPLHFRYQAPSQNDLYRQAWVVAPDLFLFCPDKDQSVTNVSQDETARKHFEANTGITKPKTWQLQLVQIDHEVPPSSNERTHTSWLSSFGLASKLRDATIYKYGRGAAHPSFNRYNKASRTSLRALTVAGTVPDDCKGFWHTWWRFLHGLPRTINHFHP